MLLLPLIHILGGRDEDPDPVIFGPPDPDPGLFSTDPDPDPTCNNGFIFYKIIFILNKI